MAFQHQLFIPFHLADVAGVLFFGHVFTLAHQTFEAFVVEELKMEWNQWFRHQEWMAPIKQTEAIYTHPLVAGDFCSIHLSVSKIGSSSFQTTCLFYQKEIECCAVKLTHVFCSLSTRQKCAIPFSIRLDLDNRKA